MGPVQDERGMFHVCWVWRETSDCSTNHDLCYARSPDLVHWEKSDGAPLKLPITLAFAEVVDPVPQGGGIINGNTKVGFDAEGRVILSYHKHDDEGHTQVYNARRENDGWKIVQATDWDYHWGLRWRGQHCLRGPSGVRFRQRSRHARSELAERQARRRPLSIGSGKR